MVPGCLLCMEGEQSMKKGDRIEGVIEEIRFPNRGVFHEGDTEVQVKNALPGQKVAVRVSKKRSHTAEAGLLEVLEKSPKELEPPCPQSGVCGGCLYLSLPYEETLNIKQIQVMKLLQGALDLAREEGKERETWQSVTSWYTGILSSPRIFGFRNKMEFTFGDEEKGGPLTLGMHRRGSFHDIADASSCVIVDGDFRQILAATRQFFTERNIPFLHRYQQEGYLRHLLVRKAAHTGEILVDLVTTRQAAALPVPEETLLGDFAACLERLPLEGELVGVLHTRNDSIADVVEDQGTDVLYGRDYFLEKLLGLTFKVTPFSFFQTNSYSAEVLYSTARQYIQGLFPPLSEDGSLNRGPVIYDLYCGTGTISQLVAPTASHVYGIEIVEEAVQAAKENAERNGIKNCTFVAGDVLKKLDELEEKPDLIILDPPRDGIHPKALPKILAYGVPYILYISCKPTSLARDLPSFLHEGYRPVKGCSVDQFCFSGNVETIVLLKKEQ